MNRVSHWSGVGENLFTFYCSQNGWFVKEILVASLPHENIRSAKRKDDYTWQTRRRLGPDSTRLDEWIGVNKNWDRIRQDVWDGGTGDQLPVTVQLGLPISTYTRIFRTPLARVGDSKPVAKLENSAANSQVRRWGTSVNKSNRLFIFIRQNEYHISSNGLVV